MKYTHSNSGECIYPEIRSLLEGAGYFRNPEDISCSCSNRWPSYTPEWDYEYREYFDIYSKGAFGVAKFLSTIISLDLRKKDDESSQFIQLSPALKEKLREVPLSNRKKISKLIRSIISSEIPPYVNRVLVTNGGAFLGWIDIRPMIDGGITEAYIKPPARMVPPQYYLTCEREIIPVASLRPRSGEVEKIECVPYVQYAGSGEIGVCAQYAARLVLLTLKGINAPTVPEITSSAVKEILLGGIERSREEGLTVGEIAHILEREGYNIFKYSRILCDVCGQPFHEIKCINCGNRLSISPVSMEPNIENIYAYVESGFPVLLGVERAKLLEWWDGKGDEPHALVAIGHTLSENDKVDGLIVHDVSKYPYQVLTDPHNGKPLEEIINEAIVPVPREVTIRYQIAREMILELLKVELEEGEEYRPMLVEADKVKRWLGEGVKRDHFDDYHIPQEVQEDFSSAFLDRYVWLFEIKKSLGNGKREYKGDILYSGTNDRILGFNIPDLNIYGFIDENDVFQTKKYL